MKVLVTGFEPNDDGLNASEIVVNALQRSPPVGLAQYVDEMCFQILPGNTHLLREAIEDKLSSLLPDICIGVCQARGYNKIAIERMAKNLRYFVTPDKTGNAPKGIPIVLWWGDRLLALPVRQRRDSAFARDPLHPS